VARRMVCKNSLPQDDDYYAFSFSGLKTAVLNAVRASKDIEPDKADIARGFQDAMIDTLVEKTWRAADAFSRQRVVLGGGVACNRKLADAMRTRDRKSTRLNSSHEWISYAVFCLKKKKKK